MSATVSGRRDFEYSHACHAQNGDESELLIPTHVQVLDEEDWEGRKCEVADCEDSRHHIGENYDDVHADACSHFSKCPVPKELNRVALECGEETVHHTHNDAGVDDGVGDDARLSMGCGRVTEERQANRDFGPYHGKAVREVTHPPELSSV